MEPLTSQSRTTLVFLIRRLRFTRSIISPPYFMLLRMVQRGSTALPLRARFLRRLICVAILVAISKIARAGAPLFSAHLAEDLLIEQILCGLGWNRKHL